MTKRKTAEPQSLKEKRKLHNPVPLAGEDKSRFDSEEKEDMAEFDSSW